jgi:hypothetical protein
MTTTALDTMAPVAVTARVRAGLGHSYRWAMVVPAGVCFQHTSNATAKRSTRRLGRTLT